MPEIYDLLVANNLVECLITTNGQINNEEIFKIEKMLLLNQIKNF